MTKYKIYMTEGEMQIIAGLIDAGLKSIGLRAAKDAVIALEVLERAKEVKIDGNLHKPDPSD